MATTFTPAASAMSSATSAMFATFAPSATSATFATFADVRDVRELLRDAANCERLATECNPAFASGYLNSASRDRKAAAVLVGSALSS